MSDTNREAMFTAFHRWYYEDAEVWEHTRWLGVKTYKAVGDLWSYQEILVERRPALVVELGTARGGTALFFASVLDALALPTPIVSVDIDLGGLDPRVAAHERIETVECSSTSDAFASLLAERRVQHPGSLLVTIDSDHRADHVLAELELLAPKLQVGDYVVVEDGNINGHPVLEGWGPGPTEALKRFNAEHPALLCPDTKREHKFGLTFSPGGWLEVAEPQN